jgi:hypothetical protein
MEREKAVGTRTGLVLLDKSMCLTRILPPEDALIVPPRNHGILG